MPTANNTMEPGVPNTPTIDQELHEKVQRERDQAIRVIGDLTKYYEHQIQSLVNLVHFLKIPPNEDGTLNLSAVVPTVEKLKQERWQFSALADLRAGELESLKIELQQLRQTANTLANARELQERAAEVAFRRDLVVAIAAQHIENSSAKWICIQADDVARTQLARERDRLEDEKTVSMRQQEEQDGEGTPG